MRRSLKETVIIADEDPTMSKSLGAYLQNEGCSVLQVQSKSALENAGMVDGNPTVLILGDIGGVSFVRELRRGGWDMPILMLHTASSIREAVKAIQAGADDYLTKPITPDLLWHSVKSLLVKARAQAELSQGRHELLKKVSSLSKRERQIIDLVLQGKLNKEIADDLKLALVTIKVHRGHAMRKIGARTAGELARIAKEAGLLPRVEG